MDLATECLYLGDHGVDRHCLILWNTHSVFPNSWSDTLLQRFHKSTQYVLFLMRSCRAFIEVCNLRGSLLPGSISHLHARNTLSHKLSLDVMWGAAECWWWTVWLIAPSFHRIASEWVWSCTSTQWSRELRDALGGHYLVNLEMHLEAMIKQVGRCTLGPWSCRLAGHARAGSQIHLESVTQWDWSTWRWSIWRWQIFREAQQQLRLYTLVNS